MNFQLSESQTMARESAREFAQKRLKPLAREFDEHEEIPRSVYKEAADLGFFGMLIPEAYGGLGLDYVAYALVMEELSRASAAFTVCITVHNSLVSSALVRFGTEAQKKAYLPKLASGDAIGAYSLSEPGSGTDAGSLVCRARLEGGSYVIDGTKAWVSSAGFADLFLLFVSTSPEKGSRGVSCLLVEKDVAGLTLGQKEKKMGIRGSDTRELVFSGSKVPQGALLGVQDEGFKIALAQLDNGRIGIAAQAVGIAQAAYDEALAYAKVRKQFGKTLAEHQAVQFKLADMAMGTEAARLLTLKAAALADAGQRPTQAASMAKLFASENANRVAHQALQVHGGNGYIREFPVERYFRDARVTEIYEGTSEVQRLVIAREALRA